MIKDASNINFLYSNDYNGGGKDRTTRLFFFDCLKVIALLAMIMQHESARVYISENFGTIDWRISAIINAFTRFCVPLFVMISGALFLSKHGPIKKYVIRIIIALCVWMIIYTIFFKIEEILSIHSMLDIPKIFQQFLHPGHLWFLYMLCGLYLLTPLIRLCVRKNYCEYLLGLWLVFSVIIPTLSNLGVASNFLDSLRNLMHIGKDLDYVGYYVLGYYLFQYCHFKNKSTSIILICFGLLTMICFGIIYPIKDETGLLVLHNNLSPATVCIAIGIFTLFQYGVAHQPKEGILLKFITFASSYSLGIYAIHKIFETIIHHYYIFSSNAVSQIFIGWLIVFACSCISVLILNKIPIVNKIV